MLDVVDDNCNAKVRTIDYKSEATDTYDVPFKLLLGEYKPFNQKLSELVSVDPEQNKAWAFNVVQAKVIIALNILSERYDGMKVMCRTPKSLFATEHIKRGECVLVPLTKKMKFTENENDNSIFISGVDGKKVVLQSMGCSNAVPVWFCNSTTEKKDANVKVSMVKVNVSVGVPGKGAKKSNDSSSSSVDVPVLVNTCALNEGDSLAYYVEEKVKSQVKRTFDLI